MSASPQGGRTVVDADTRLADQAGIAEVLLEAFDASREQAYLADAARALKPLLEEPVALRGPNGYVSGFDLRGSVLGDFDGLFARDVPRFGSRVGFRVTREMVGGAQHGRANCTLPPPRERAHIL